MRHKGVLAASFPLHNGGLQGGVVVVLGVGSGVGKGPRLTHAHSLNLCNCRIISF